MAWPGSLRRRHSQIVRPAAGSDDKREGATGAARGGKAERAPHLLTTNSHSSMRAVGFSLYSWEKSDTAATNEPPPGPAPSAPSGERQRSISMRVVASGRALMRDLP
jgi:hypothetical protein